MTGNGNKYKINASYIHAFVLITEIVIRPGGKLKKMMRVVQETPGKNDVFCLSSIWSAVNEEFPFLKPADQQSSSHLGSRDHAV